MDRRFPPAETELLAAPDELASFLEREIARRDVDIPAEDSGALLELRLESEDIATMTFMLCRRADGRLLIQAPRDALRKMN